MKKKDPSENKEQLGRLLERYKVFLKPPQASVEKECLQVISEVTGIMLRSDQVSYTVATKTLYIKAPSLLRSELLLRRVELLEAFKGRLGGGSAPSSIL
ncbi:MAG: hypothetical protein RL538_176 [Candidatus Parcubacteria bacterium]|jgi:hypothetical protein